MKTLLLILLSISNTIYASETVTLKLGAYLTEGLYLQNKGCMYINFYEDIREIEIELKEVEWHSAIVGTAEVVFKSEREDGQTGAKSLLSIEVHKKWDGEFDIFVENEIQSYDLRREKWYNNKSEMDLSSDVMPLVLSNTLSIHSTIRETCYRSTIELL